MESTSASPPRNPYAPVPPPQTTERGENDAEPANSTHRKISDIRHGVGEGVDRLLDESHRFKSAVRAAFEQFQLPRPANELPLTQLLPALQFFVQVPHKTLIPFTQKPTSPPPLWLSLVKFFYGRFMLKVVFLSFLKLLQF
jgi:hypothetical protein